VQINLLNVYSIILCCVLPYGAIVTILLVQSIKARLKYRDQILAAMSKTSEDNLLSIPRRYIPVYVTVSLTLIGSLLCTMVLTLTYYLGFPIISKIDIRTLGVISLIILLIAIVMTPVLMFVSSKMFKE
jgi:hypothetical protein